MMGAIVTVTGAMTPAEVDACILGEHLLARFAVERPEKATDSWFFEQTVRMELLGDLMLGRANRDDAVLEATHAEVELTRFAAVGGTLVVDVTTPAQGRDARGLRRLSERAGMRVVMAATATDNADTIVAELTVGVDGVRAGVVVLDISDARTAEAAWAAARRTGAPVIVRADAEAVLGAVRAARAAGIDARRIAIAGAGVFAPAAETLESLAATGARLLFDRLGRIPTIRTRISDHEIAVAIAGLIKRGRGEQILLGAGLDRKHATTSFGGNGLRFVPKQFLPYLGMLGVAPEQARALVTANPAQFLTWGEAAE